MIWLNARIDIVILFLSRILQTFVAGRFQHRHDCHRDDADCQQSRIKKNGERKKSRHEVSLLLGKKRMLCFWIVYWSDFLGVCVNCLLFHNLRGNKRRFADRDWCGIINPHRMMTSSFCTGLVSRSASSQCVRHSKWTSPKKCTKQRVITVQRLFQLWIFKKKKKSKRKKIYPTCNLSINLMNIGNLVFRIFYGKKLISLNGKLF